jgi:hypothetical protein
VRNNASLLNQLVENFYQRVVVNFLVLT